MKATSRESAAAMAATVAPSEWPTIPTRSCTTSGPGAQPGHGGLRVLSEVEGGGGRKCSGRGGVAAVVAAQDGQPRAGDGIGKN